MLLCGGGDVIVMFIYGNSREMVRQELVKLVKRSIGYGDGD